MWRTACASVTGTSHMKHGTECQDASAIKYLGDNGLALFVCDGLSSKPHSREGAECVINAAFAFLQTYSAMNKEMAKQCLGAVDAALHTLAQEKTLAQGRKISPRDFACTFLMVVVRDGKTLTMQVGDGGIALDFSGQLKLVPAPHAHGESEYANVTDCVPQASKYFCTWHEEIPARIAVFSDGVEFVAVDQRQEPPAVHQPFFTPWFTALRESDDPTATCNEALAAYLSDDKVNELTDDDKTLALAVNLEKYRPSAAQAKIEPPPPPPPVKKQGENAQGCGKPGASERDIPTPLRPPVNKPGKNAPGREKPEASERDIPTPLRPPVNKPGKNAPGREKPEASGRDIPTENRDAPKKWRSFLVKFVKTLLLLAIMFAVALLTVFLTYPFLQGQQKPEGNEAINYTAPQPVQSTKTDPAKTESDSSAQGTSDATTTFTPYDW